MRKIGLVASFISVFCVFSFISNAMADPKPYLLEQETYLLQKLDNGPDPWTIILPDSDGETVAFGKLEYFNYNDLFSFDFKGYDFGEDFVEYALIYYVDTAIGWSGGPPTSYVLGISSGPYASPASSKGKAKGLVGVDFKIDGSCDIEQIPIADDLNYPNGGKIWLVPTEYLGYPTDACAPATWTGWPSDGTGILFETSLITYGFEPIVD